MGSQRKRKLGLEDVGAWKEVEVKGKRDEEKREARQSVSQGEVRGEESARLGEIASGKNSDEVGRGGLASGAS